MRSRKAEPGLLAKRHGSRGHFSAIASLVVASLAMAACAHLPAYGTRTAPPAQPLSRMEVATAGADADVRTWLLAAEFALQDDDPARAAQAYARAAALSGDRAVAARALQVALAARDPGLAQLAIGRMQKLGASPGEVAGGRAELALSEGDRASAEAGFRLQLAAGKLEDWKAFAAALLAARDAALAGRILEDVATPARLPADESLWVALSQLAEHLGRHAFALELADAAVQRFAGVDAIRWAGSLRVAMHDSAAALALYARGVAAHPADIDLRLGYAALLADAGKEHEAMQVLARGPQSDSTWAARIVYAAKAKDDPALRQMYAQLQSAPAVQRQHMAFLLGELAELLGHDPQALHWYAQVDPDGPHAFDAQVRSATLLDKQGRSVQAHALAVQLQIDYADDAEQARTAYELDAQLYSRHGDHARAIAAYDRGLAALPDDAVLTYDRGIEQAMAGDTEAALAAFRAVLAREPDNVEAMNALGFTLADAGRDLAQATALLRKALAARPDAAEVMDSWGWLQYRLGNLGQAEAFLQRAWKLHQDPDIGVHLGEVLWQLGQHQHARELFARVRKLDPHNDALARAERKLHP